MVMSCAEIAEKEFLISQMQENQMGRTSLVF